MGEHRRRPHVRGELGRGFGSVHPGAQADAEQLADVGEPGRGVATAQEVSEQRLWYPLPQAAGGSVVVCCAWSTELFAFATFFRCCVVPFLCVLRSGLKSAKLQRRFDNSILQGRTTQCSRRGPVALVQSCFSNLDSGVCGEPAEFGGATVKGTGRS